MINKHYTIVFLYYFGCFLLFSFLIIGYLGSSYDTIKLLGGFMEQIIERLVKFNQDRDWDQFHSPVNLSKSIMIEAAELLEHFQWSNEMDNKEAVIEELADVLLYASQLAERLGVNPIEIMNNKMDKNEAKYPADKARGSSKKYTEL